MDKNIKVILLMTFVHAFSLAVFPLPDCMTLIEKATYGTTLIRGALIFIVIGHLLNVAARRFNTHKRDKEDNHGRNSG